MFGNILVNKHGPHNIFNAHGGFMAPKRLTFHFPMLGNQVLQHNARHDNSEISSIVLIKLSPMKVYVGLQPQACPGPLEQTRAKQILNLSPCPILRPFVLHLA